MVQLANAIELGQVKTGMVVSCESARQIVEQTIDRLLKTRDMAVLKKSLATLTGGSGAVAVILSHRRLGDQGHHLQGGVARSNASCHRLCVWGPDTGIPATMPLVMETDSVGVLENGVALGKETYHKFKDTIWPHTGPPDKIICHQVGSTHQRTILDALNIPLENDFATYRYLGNIGTVSLPITAAIASERGFLQTGDRVGLFGIGSGLNCLLLGVRW
jgi:3-oxoacyl-[acyl-carrier-protein] synthase-3